MTRDDSVLYGQRQLLTLKLADCIQIYLYAHIYGLVTVLGRIQSSFSSITVSIGYEPGTHYYLDYMIFKTKPLQP